jgi:hypothetical protein
MISVNAIKWRKIMRKRLLLIAVVAFFSYNFFLPQFPSEKQDISLKVVQFGKDFLNISWKIQDLNIATTRSNNSSISRITFDGYTFPQEVKGYEVPITSFLIGKPQNSKITFELSNIVYEVRDNVNLTPFARFGRDKNGISIIDNVLQSDVKDATVTPTIKALEQHFLRDLPVVQVEFYPIRYDPLSREVRIIKSADIKIKFSEASVKETGYRSGNSRLDRL